jgi:hypothetical protein
VKRAITFDPTVGSRSKFHNSFAESVFLVVPMESQFVEEEALWSQTGITSEMGDNI